MYLVLCKYMFDYTFTGPLNKPITNALRPFSRNDPKVKKTNNDQFKMIYYTKWLLVFRDLVA